jgi:excisionase family DNA binding protein
MTPYLTIEQVAALYGVNRKTVSAWIASGEMVAVNATQSRRAANKRWRITQESIRLFDLKRQSQPPVETPRRFRMKTVKQYV